MDGCHHHHNRDEICEDLHAAIRAVEKAREALKSAAEDTDNCFYRSLLRGFVTTLKGVLEGLRAILEEKCQP